jgi:hypothetical protein
MHPSGLFVCRAAKSKGYWQVTPDEGVDIDRLGDPIEFDFPSRTTDIGSLPDRVGNFLIERLPNAESAICAQLLGSPWLAVWQS